jgi:hypothetical protein
MMKSQRSFAFVSAACLAMAMALCAQPAAAQVDLEGNWTNVLPVDFRARLYGPPAVDYLGIPINADARAGALSYDVDMVSVPGHQCTSWGPQYVLQSPFDVHIWADSNPDTDQVVTWNLSGWNDWAPMKIWMDARKPPAPDGPRSQTGFSTGVWQGDTLVSTTTNTRDGYLTRGGIPSSDQETFTLWITRHDEMLTMTGIVEDPVYLTEPYILSRNYRLGKAAPGSGLNAHTPCIQDDEVPALEHGAVPNFLPGKNPSVDELTRHYHIPKQAVLGGAQTMYPEYRDRIRGQYTPPAACTINCCGWGNFLASSNPKLECKEDAP